MSGDIAANSFTVIVFSRLGTAVLPLPCVALHHPAAEFLHPGRSAWTELKHQPTIGLLARDDNNFLIVYTFNSLKITYPRKEVFGTESWREWNCLGVKNNGRELSWYAEMTIQSIGKLSGRRIVEHLTVLFWYMCIDNRRHDHGIGLIYGIITTCQILVQNLIIAVCSSFKQSITILWTT